MKKLITLVAMGGALAGWTATDCESVRQWFLDNEYGVRPAAAERPKVEFSAAEPDRLARDGSLRKAVKVTSHGPYGDHVFTFYAFIPKSPKPVPATLLLCNRPGAMPIDPDGDGMTSVFWPRAEIVKRGYAAVAFYLSDLARETYRPETALRSGVFKAYERYEERTPRSWGVLSAWAWGASRVMDWMEREKLIDAQRVMVVGHSRGGKCALCAGVLDRRFAMVVPNDAGRGGTRLNRMTLAGSEPWRSFRYFGVSYWFCGNYCRAFEPDDGYRCEHDQDEWMSLVAPRILAVGSAAADAWAGPEGECAATRKAAETWWRAGVPENLQYGIREGGHDLNAIDWKRYLDFADARWRGATVRVAANADGAAVQKALDDPRRPLTVVVPKGVYTVKQTLRVHAGTTIKAHPEARFVLDGSVEHHAGDFLVANADEKGGDRDITIEGGVWDGNKEVGFNVKVPQEKKFDPTSWSGATANFRNVKNLRLYDMTFANSVVYNLRLCEVDGFDFRRLRIVSPVVKNNQDGIHFGGCCFNGVVDGLEVETKGQTNDDLIALNADDSLTRHENRGLVNGPITNIVVRRVYAEDCHCLVRILKAYSDIRDILIEDCAAGCRYNAINGDDGKFWMNCGTRQGADEKPVTAASTGVFANIKFRNVRYWASVKNGFPLVKVDGLLGGRGVEFDNCLRDWTKDVDPGRPTWATGQSRDLLGADALARQGLPKAIAPQRQLYWTPTLAFLGTPDAAALRRETDALVDLGLSTRGWEYAKPESLPKPRACAKAVWDKWGLKKVPYDRGILNVGPNYECSREEILGEKQLGNDFSHNEQALQFLYWAFAGNPIVLSCRLTQADGFIRDLASNESLLALVRDESTPTYADGGTGAVVGARTVRGLADGEMRVWGLFNFSEKPQWIKLPSGAPAQCRDLLLDSPVATGADGILLPPHSARILASDAP